MIILHGTTCIEQIGYMYSIYSHCPIYSLHDIYFAICITSRRKVEVEVGKLSKQLEEVKSLLREITKHTYQQSTPETHEQVPSDGDEEPSY